MQSTLSHIIKWFLIQVAVMLLVDIIGYYTTISDIFFETMYHTSLISVNVAQITFLKQKDFSTIFTVVLFTTFLSYVVFAIIETSLPNIYLESIKTLNTNDVLIVFILACLKGGLLAKFFQVQNNSPKNKDIIDS